MERWNAVFFPPETLFVLFLSFSLLKRSTTKKKKRTTSPFAAGLCVKCSQSHHCAVQSTDKHSISFPRRVQGLFQCHHLSLPHKTSHLETFFINVVAGEWRAPSAASAAWYVWPGAKWKRGDPC